MGNKVTASEAQIDGDAIVLCEKCLQPGRRRPGHPCPDHWFYLQSIDRTPGKSKGKTTVHIVWVCSEACRDAMWERGPGPNVIDEKRRTIDG
jgi:hypothetical protein